MTEYRTLNIQVNITVFDNLTSALGAQAHGADRLHTKLTPIILMPRALYIQNVLPFHPISMIVYFMYVYYCLDRPNILQMPIFFLLCLASF